MPEFLHSNAPLLIGAILAILLIALRAASSDRVLRKDLQGAILFLIAFLTLRAVGALFDPYLPVRAARLVRVAWILAFTFGVIRALVSFALWTVRLRSRGVTPKILRDVIDFSLYTFTALPILKWQLDIDLTGLLATSAIVSVVLGLALQDTLGNLFAGLSIQLERPFQVGDCVAIGQHSGQVMQIAWRATRIETFRREVVTLPNNILSKEAVKNFSRGAQPVAIDLYFTVSYDSPPNLVKQTVLDLLEEIPLLLQDPKPKCRTWELLDSAIRYQIRYFVADYLDSDTVMDEIHSRLWYCFRREQIALPYPRRTLLMRNEERKADLAQDSVGALIDTVDLFSTLPPEERAALSKDVVPRPFGKGERIVAEGEAGQTFYIVAQGQVSVRKRQTEVASLKSGDHFGEMSLLTGEPSTATVVAASDVVLLELDRAAFGRLFAEHPGFARQLSSIVARRRSQLREITEATTERNDPAPEAGRIFSKLRQIFGLAYD